MRICLIESDRDHCGIREHALFLQQAVQAADPSVEILRDQTGQGWVDPARWFKCAGNYDLIHLDYHRGLHSRWTPEEVRRLALRAPVVITFHDTYEVQPDRLPWDLLEHAAAMIVHEPCDLQDTHAHPVHRGLPASVATGKVHYWRQGVPTYTVPPYAWRESQFRPLVGTVGFPFPWKGFDLLAEAAALAGWGVVILAPGATPAQVQEWHRLNPWAYVETEFLPAEGVVSHLRGCDATAFLYSCANSGTSGAIRLGIAAGKPVIAADGCRQFRDLQDGKGWIGIRWVETLSPLRVADAFACTRIARFHTSTVALAQQDSWVGLGRKHLDLYRAILEAQ